MTDLIKQLETAEAGRRELDFAIARGIKWEAVGGFGDPDWRLGDSAPHFTTRLDAALPWENIISVYKIAADRRHGKKWRAVHQNSNGHGFDAIAATEPLARRAAALKEKM